MELDGLEAGLWYEDRELGHRFKVLAVHSLTVDVVDEASYRRTVNRLMFESQMVVSKRQPV